MMYKIKVVDGVVMKKSGAVEILEGEYEITQELFLALSLPCRVEIVDGVPVFGETLTMAQLPEPIYNPPSEPLPEEEEG